MLDRYFSSNVFEEPGYHDHYPKLFEMVEPYLGDVSGKRVLDLGCGYGWWGLKLKQLGAVVTFADGRMSNLEGVKRSDADATVLWLDVESGIIPRPFDLVLCMGLLYHLGDPQTLLDKVAARTKRMLIDTTCLDHDGEFIVYHREADDVSQFSVTGNACRPSPTWVVNALYRAGFDKVSDISSSVGNRKPQPGFPGLVYDWKYQRTCGWRRGERTLRKMFLAEK